jgi:hypothetical protein
MAGKRGFCAVIPSVIEQAPFLLSTLYVLLVSFCSASRVWRNLSLSYMSACTYTLGT